MRKIPEESRLAVKEIIISSYIKSFIDGDSCEKLWTTYENSKYSSKGFLKLFKKIYTLNYDPLMYFDFLDVLDSKIFSDKAKLEFADGFLVKNRDFIEQKDIVNALTELEKEVNIFTYLHGSYFINIDKTSNCLHTTRHF